MAKYRETICMHYISKGSCAMNKDASHKGICQHCTKYKPRAKEKHENRKRRSVEKERSKIYDD